MTVKHIREYMTFLIAVNDCSGPVAIRYPKGVADTQHYSESAVEYGKGTLCIKDGDILLVALGSTVKDAVCTAKLLAENNISAKVMNARFLKPFDSKLFKETANNCRLVAVIEDNVEIGGLAATIRKEYSGEVLEFAFPDKPLMQGSVAQQKMRAGLTPEQIAKKITEILGE